LCFFEPCAALKNALVNYNTALKGSLGAMFRVICEIDVKATAYWSDQIGRTNRQILLAKC
jgi:hypothetical protein